MKENIAKKGLFCFLSLFDILMKKKLLSDTKLHIFFFWFLQDLFWIKRIIASPDRIPTLNSSFVDVGYISM